LISDILIKSYKNVRKLIRFTQTPVRRCLVDWSRNFATADFVMNGEDVSEPTSEKKTTV